MEPKLSKQAQTILEQLTKDLEKRLLTPEQFEFIRISMLERESRALVRRFFISTAAVIGGLLSMIAAGIGIYNSLGGSR